MELIISVLIAGISSLFVYIYFSKKNHSVLAKRDQLSIDNSRLITENESLQNTLSETEHLLSIKEKDLIRSVERNNSLQLLITESKQIQQSMKDQFNLIAQHSLEKNQDKLQEQQKTQLSLLLSPFQEKMTHFEKLISSSIEKNAEGRNVLFGEVKRLTELNKTLADEAKNLSDALKGDNKAQGNWGELILEKILENSGLIKGREFDVQPSFKDENGNIKRPDVIIKLPEDKHIIIDSKVSLVAYEQYVNTANTEEQKVFMEKHLLSLNTHIKGLSTKNYDQLPSLQTPDFVLLFLPIEGALLHAIKANPSLYSSAWEQRVVLVTPSTLLVTLRTIASIWKLDQQNKNAEEIAYQAGKLYDKFAGLIEDLETVQKNIKLASDSTEKAFGKLQYGKGNLIGKVEKLKQLGAKTQKNLNHYLDE